MTKLNHFMNDQILLIIEKALVIGRSIVIGKTGHSVLLTVVDRYSGLILIRKIDHKEHQDVNQGLVKLLSALPKEFVHSITPDHGREFLNLVEIKEHLGVAIYWPDPYSPE